MESLWTWLSTPPGKDEVLDLFGVVCLLLFVPGFVVSAYLAGSGADRLAKDPVQLAGIRYCASIGLWVFGAGLFFFGARVMQINPLSFGEPKWLLASIDRRHLRRGPLHRLVANGVSERNGHAASPRKPSIHSPILGATLAARRPGKRLRRRPSGDKRRHAERPALVMSEASKIGRAPLVDLGAPACRRSLAQVRLPLVTRGGRFTAATFRS